MALTLVTAYFLLQMLYQMGFHTLRTMAGS